MYSTLLEYRSVALGSRHSLPKRRRPFSHVRLEVAHPVFENRRLEEWADTGDGRFWERQQRDALTEHIAYLPDLSGT
jgi:hypothetical protein